MRKPPDFTPPVDPKPLARWDPNISLGNIGAIITFIFLFGVAYAKLNYHDTQISEVKSDVKEMKSLMWDLKGEVKSEGQKTRNEQNQ